MQSATVDVKGPPHGDFFKKTVVALKPIWLVRFFSGVMIFSGIVAFAYNVMATVVGRREYVQ